MATQPLRATDWNPCFKIKVKYYLDENILESIMREILWLEIISTSKGRSGKVAYRVKEVVVSN